jgi:lipopolysaccharide transport system ATP-binding protein
MTDIAIRAENLSKQYKIGETPQRYVTLRDKLVDNLKRLFRANGRANPGRNTIWALQDVSFEVKHGEVLGIIGHNGAGKSTLLKILSRITEPTAGFAELRGRVASLLEVGTGFHPELTGRENIYLNAAILGMRKVEINRKFDAIIDFAGVEKFLDTPMKRYSSGMNVRLAFAVAAHLEPEILLVDEVLAVGDAAFQHKCLVKMEDVAKEGRTVVFISHNMAMVENLCQRGVILQGGKVQFIGTQTDAVARYLTGLSENDSSLRDRIDRVGSGKVRVVAIEARDVHGNVIDITTSGQDIDIYVFFENLSGYNRKGIVASLIVTTQLDVPVFLQHNRLTRDEFGVLPPSGAMVCRIRQLPLPASTYRLGIGLYGDNGRGECLDRVDNAIELPVVEGDFYGSGEVPPISHGVCLVQAKWRLEPTPHENHGGNGQHSELVKGC